MASFTAGGCIFIQGGGVTAFWLLIEPREKAMWKKVLEFTLFLVSGLVFVILRAGNSFQAALALLLSCYEVVNGLIFEFGLKVHPDQGETFRVCLQKL